MKNADIEQTVSRIIRKASEDAIIKAIHELNSSGHNYQPLDDVLFEWAEPGSEDSLKISCAIGVGISAKEESKSVDPILQSFISLGESGDDVEATILNQMEGDIANGGFMQLFDNKGEQFIKGCIGLLQKIKSKAALHIVEQAQLLFQDERDTLKRYENFRNKVGDLDSLFWKLKESIPALFMRYRRKKSG